MWYYYDEHYGLVAVNNRFPKAQKSEIEIILTRRVFFEEFKVFNVQRIILYIEI